MNPVVKLLARWHLVSALALLVLACEREIPPVIETESFSGYRIEGIVSDRLGNPVRGVPIALSYDYELVDDAPPPSKTYEVVDENKSIRVAVYDRENRLLRLLFQGHASPGPLLVGWDQSDNIGNPVPSGVYSVQYIVDSQLKMSYPVTVSGAVTARTDSLGHYVIPDKNLPVGFYPVPLYSSDGRSYLGSYRISSYMVLEFQLEPKRAAGVVLMKDQVTRVDIKV
jgi:hypothetical protein